MPRNMTIPLSFRLPLDDDCGVTTRNRPAPRNADEDDIDPTWRVEEEGANAPLGLGNVVNTAKKPGTDRRVADVFVTYFFISVCFEKSLSERGTRKSKY